ncbi:MAG: hypothetical protein IJI21_07220 [Clostridia bacterium]|nr:hypothetical protein [Clostridia bacterium]
MRTKNRELMEQIKRFIEEYAIDSGGETPTMREIGEKLGVSHVLVIRYLREMDELGMIYYRDGKPMTERIRQMQEKGFVCEFYPEGSAAGPGLYNEGRVELCFSLPPILVDGRQGHYCMVPIQGESMIEAGIEDGDMVICRKQETANIGDIVLAWIEGEGNTVKRLSRDSRGRECLMAENKSDRRQNYGTDFQVQGVVVKILRDVD